MSQEQCSIWPWILVHLCRMMISPGVFFICFKFSFSGLLEGKRPKNSPKWKITITSVMCYISGTVWIWSLVLVHFCKMMISPGHFCLSKNIGNDHDFWYTIAKCWYLQVFFSFLFLILIFRAVRGIKGISYLRNHTSYDYHFWYTCVK